MSESKVVDLLLEIEDEAFQNYPIRMVPLFYTIFRTIESCTKGPNSVLNCKQYSKHFFQAKEYFLRFKQQQRLRNKNVDKVMAHMILLTEKTMHNLNTKMTYAVNQTELYSGNSGQETESIQSKERSASCLSKIDSLLTSSPKSSNLAQYNKESIGKVKIKEKKKLQLLFAEPIVEKSAKSEISIPSEKEIKTLQSGSFEQIQRLYEEHRLDEAYQQMRKLNHAGKITQSHECELREIIESEYTQMAMFYSHFDLTGYKKDKTEDGMTMYYKILEKENLVAVQIEGEFDISLENFLSLTSEIELFEKYIPFNYETKLIKDLSRNKKIGLSKIYMPFLNNRKAYFEARAYDRLATNNSVFLFSKSLSPQTLQHYDITPNDDHLVNLDYRFFLLEYRPVSKTRGQIRMASSIDLKINFAPKFVLNKSARIFAFDYFKNMIKVNLKFSGSEWEKAVKNKPEFYSFFNSKISEHFDSK